MCVVVNRYYHGLFGKSSLQKKMLTIRLLVTLLLCFDDDAMLKKPNHKMMMEQFITNYHTIQSTNVAASFI